MDGGAVMGAVEFYARHRIDLDESLLEALSTLGHQIGQTLERRRTADALGESERLKAAILALSPDGVITVDAKGAIVEFNETAERMFGRSAVSVIGSDLAATIFPAETHASHRRAFTRALDGDKAVLGRRLEVEALGPDGQSFPVELAMTRTAAGAAAALHHLLARHHGQTCGTGPHAGKRSPLPHHRQRHPAARLDDGRIGQHRLVQPALVRLHRHHPRADGRVGLAGSASPRPSGRRGTAPACQLRRRVRLGRHVPAAGCRRHV